MILWHLELGSCFVGTSKGVYTKILRIARGKFSEFIYLTAQMTWGQNRGMVKTVLNIAHRGGGGLWPENTLLAFEHAISMGIDGVELDLQLAADGRLVLHHDRTLNLAATRHDGAWLPPPSPSIADLTYPQLARYDVGRLVADSTYAQARPERTMFDGVSIPDFTSFCALIAQAAPPEFRLYADLKTAMDTESERVFALADAFVATVSVAKLIQPIIAISFDWRAIARVQAGAPHLLYGFTTIPFALSNPHHATADIDTPVKRTIRGASGAGGPWWGEHDWRDYSGTSHGIQVLNALAQATDAIADAKRKKKSARRGLWCGYWHDIDPLHFAHAQSLGLEVAAWGVNNADDMRTLRTRGVSAIMTERPDILQNL